MTDAEIASSEAACPVGPSQPFFGIDHLNGVVANGHAPLPPNTIITQDNVSTLTGLTPQQFADSASESVGQVPGFFYWGLAGNLSMAFVGGRSYVPPFAIDSRIAFNKGLWAAAALFLGFHISLLL